MNEKKKKEKIEEKENDTWKVVVEAFYKKEEDENVDDKIICKTCGNDTFRVYCTIVIDDARLYCTKCGKDPEE